MQLESITGLSFWGSESEPALFVCVCLGMGSDAQLGGERSSA